MFNKVIPFKFKGERSYIHGTDLFNEVIKVFGLGAVSHINLTFHDLITNNVGTIYISEHFNEIKSLSSPQVTGFLTKDQKKFWLAYVFSDEKPSEVVRYKYDENMVIKNCKVFADMVVLNALSPYSFIETVVAMKKFLLEKRLPYNKGKVLFTKASLSKVPEAYRKIQIAIIQNLNNKLVRSKVTVDDVELGELFFSYKFE